VGTGVDVGLPGVAGDSSVDIGVSEDRVAEGVEVATCVFCATAVAVVTVSAVEGTVSALAGGTGGGTVGADLQVARTNASTTSAAVISG
jgi:hypothetical protein